MDMLTDSINSAYSAQISNLFNVLSKSLLESNGDSQEEAQQRFIKGIHFINQARYLALKACGEVPELTDALLVKNLRFLNGPGDKGWFIECGSCGGKIDLRTGKCMCDVKSL